MGQLTNVFHQKTPNPLAYKFTCTETVIDTGAYEFKAVDGPFQHPFVAGFFQNWPTERIYVAGDFVTVVKTEDSREWDEFVREVQAYIQNAMRQAAVRPEAFPEAYRLQVNPDDPELNEWFAARILPATAQDGGGIYLRDSSNGELRLKLAGACATCPYAKETIEKGIARPLAQQHRDKGIRHIQVED
jgi:Fe-S cluster biogenesis protein NfuA